MDNQNVVKVKFFAPNVFDGGAAFMSSVALFSESFRLNRAIFDKLKKRTCFIRKEQDGEFDLPIKDGLPGLEVIAGMYQQRPKLWVFVWGDQSYQFNVPVFRSGCADPFFPTEMLCGCEVAKASGDSAVPLLLIEMQHRQGIEMPEFQRFFTRWQPEWKKLNDQQQDGGSEWKQ